MVNCAIYSCLTMKIHFERAFGQSTEIKGNNDLFSRREKPRCLGQLVEVGTVKKKA